ncbi:MFS transporter [Chloroflexota bacterium]
MMAFIYLLFTGSIWSLYLFAVLMGIAAGTMLPLQPLLTAEFFGLEHLGFILACISFFGTIGGAIGPIFAGFINDATGSYDVAFISCAVLSTLAFLLGLFLTRSGEIVGCREYFVELGQDSF